MEKPDIKNAELDGLRIRQIARAKQSAMRFSSCCLIGASACGVGAMDLLWRAVHRIAYGSVGTRPLLYLLVSAALAWLSTKLFMKSRQLAREARNKRLLEPTTPPDFTGLSDGRHRISNLEQIEE